MQAPLVVLCAGKESLHEINRWHLKEKRAFELWIVAYSPETSVDGADHSVFSTGTKWDLIREVSGRIIEKNPPWLWLPDDDVAVDVTAVNSFFDRLSRYDASQMMIIAQPSLHPRHVSCAELVHRPGSTEDQDIGFVEIQMPCFSCSLLSRIVSFLQENAENKSGWGLDCVWSRWPGVCKKLVNSVVAVHTRPVDVTGGFYARYGIDPVTEKEQTIKKYVSVPVST
jgi:hypothetical protein